MRYRLRGVRARDGARHRCRLIRSFNYVGVWGVDYHDADSSGRGRVDGCRSKWRGAAFLGAVGVYEVISVPCENTFRELYVSVAR
jgi:hypothetical protein